MKRVLAVVGARCSWKSALFAALAVLVLAPSIAHAQLRNVTLTFRPPTDDRVVGFHVYVSLQPNVFMDYRDDINFIPPVDGSGNASYALTGIEQFSNVYVALKSYDATGKESAFSNQVMVAAQQQCLVTGCNDNNACTVDTCTTSGCRFDPAPMVGQTCNDGNAMTFDDMCRTNGSCSGTQAQCNVASDCSAPADVCSGPRACVNHMCVAGSTPLPNETTCSDGNASTKYDVCRAGVCRGFACGNDSQCSDGAACNGTERCVSNSCAAGTPMVCNDGNQCNGVETCVGSSCVAGTAMQCPVDDGPCFDAFCDPAQGCRVTVHPDGEMCSTAMSGSTGQCASGVCVAMPTTPTDPNDSTHPPRPPAEVPNANCANMFGPATDVRQELVPGSETTRTMVWTAPMNPIGSLFQYRFDTSPYWSTVRAVAREQNGCMGEFSVTVPKLANGGLYRWRVSGAAAPKSRLWANQYMMNGGPTSPKSKWKFAFIAGNGISGTPQSPLAAAVLESMRKNRYPLVLGGGGYALSTEAIAAGAATNATEAVQMWKQQALAVTANSMFAPVLGDTEVESFAHAETASDYAEYNVMAGTPQTPYQSYSFDYGTTHFLGVHAPTLGTIHPSTSAGAAHLAWLDADLAAARARGVRWIVVYMHSDVLSSEKQDAPQQAVRVALGTLLNKYGVSLVLSGEGDSYERTKGLRGNGLLPGVPEVEGQITTATEGVVLVRAGSGGRTAFAPWVRTGMPNWSSFRDNTYATYVQVTVSDKTLQLVTYGLDPKGKRVVLDQLKIY